MERVALSLRVIVSVLERDGIGEEARQAPVMRMLLCERVKKSSVAVPRGGRGA